MTDHVGPDSSKLAEIAERWGKTTRGPWFWHGNTDYHSESLCGYQPGAGVCEVSHE